VPLAVIAALGAMGIGDFKGLLGFVVLTLVCIAFISTAELAIQIVRSQQTRNGRHVLKVKKPV
jgi:hypothetical protein